MNRWTLTNVDTGDIEVLQIGNQLSDPKGWDEVVLTHDRDPKWHGVFKGFDQELGFYCKGGGKEFVDAAYDAKGQEARMLLHLETQCNGTWTTVINGKANYSTYRQEYVSNVLYTFITFENDDITSLLKNREDTSVDLLATESLNGTALNPYTWLGYDLNLHSKVVVVESEWSGSNHNCCYRIITTGLKELYSLPKLAIVKKDFPGTTEQIERCELDATFNGWLETAAPVANTNDSNNFKISQTVTLSWTAKGRIIFSSFDVSIPGGDCDPSTCGTNTPNLKLFDSIDFRLRVLWGNDRNETLEENSNCVSASQDTILFKDIASVGGVAPSQSFTKGFDTSGTETIQINPGDKVWIQWVMDLNYISSNGDLTLNFEYDELTINLYSETVDNPTTGKAIAIHEGWSRLCEIITDQPLAFKSEFFGRVGSGGLSYPDNGYGAFTAYMSGKTIRGFEDDLRIETNLKDMFESCWSVWGIGLGVENLNGVWVVRAEEITHFYSDTILLKLDFVPKIQMRHVQDLVYNEVELGYRKWETENTNGLDEPNTSVVWSSQFIKSNKNRLTAISPYVAGMYPIELTRREGITTKDTRYDEEIFFIALNTTTAEKIPIALTTAEKDENFVVSAGLISPETAYNLRLMPNLAYQRLANQFTGGWVKMSSDTVKLAETEGNIGVLYSYSPTTDNITFPGLVYPGGYNGSAQSNVQDKTYVDNLMGTRGLPLWEPEEYTFEYPLPFTDYLSFLANPYGLIRFSDTHKDHLEGWVMKLEYNLKIKSANFTILRKYGS